ATVVASPNDGDPAFALASIGFGLYENSYRPGTTGQVTIKIIASAPLLQPGQTSLTIGVTGTSSAGPPGMGSGALVNAASYLGNPLAPGTIISAFGTNMASQPLSAGGDALPTSMGGVSLMIA